MIDTGVYVELNELVALQYKARGVSFLPRQPVHSILSGRHASRMRGRGLDFEEIRGYLPGDDPRTIDWKVTARTRKPHVRVYTEERDRPAIVVVDQRLEMFFGSKRAMKSVVAAQVAALASWRVLSMGDRVGGILFNDSDLVEIRPHRSRRNVLHILRTLVEMNHSLQADSDVGSNPSMLNRVLKNLLRLVKHDCLIIIISDFDGIDGETRPLITQLSGHNDLIVVPVFDRLSRELPDRGRLVVSDGTLQVEVDTAKGSIRKKLLETCERRMKTLMEWWEELAIPVAPLLTDRDPVDQIRELLGQAQARRSKRR
ncbi:MAG TPA: DUF58 domain-containing protein [Nitrospirales bacterium]|nr:DUF58 domain-containing protein [Nitrospirales bacterium]